MEHEFKTVAVKLQEQGKFEKAMTQLIDAAKATIQDPSQNVLALELSNAIDQALQQGKTPKEAMEAGDQVILRHQESLLLQ